MRATIRHTLEPGTPVCCCGLFLWRSYESAVESKLMFLNFGDYYSGSTQYTSSSSTSTLDHAKYTLVVDIALSSVRVQVASSVVVV